MASVTNVCKWHCFSKSSPPTWRQMMTNPEFVTAMKPSSFFLLWMMPPTLLPSLAVFDDVCCDFFWLFTAHMSVCILQWLQRSSLYDISSERTHWSHSSLFPTDVLWPSNKTSGTRQMFCSVWVNKKSNDWQESNHRVTEGSSNANTPYGLYTYSNFELAMPKPAVKKLKLFLHFICLQSMFLLPIPLLYSTRKRFRVLFIYTNGRVRAFV